MENKIVILCKYTGDHQHILQNIFFYAQRKKEIHTSLEQLEGEQEEFTFLGEIYSSVMKL